MPTATMPCVDGLPPLLLVEPPTLSSPRASQLSHERFCVTETDCALDFFLMRQTLHFTVAVLSDHIGASFLCMAAENIRWQWPLARILILGQAPPAMNDHLYDDVAVHSVDEEALLSVIDRLAIGPVPEVAPARPPSAFQVCVKAIPPNSGKQSRWGYTSAICLLANIERIGEATMPSRPMRSLRALAVAAVAVCCFALHVHAGQHLVRDLSGMVTDAHHEPLRGAVVQVHSEGTGIVVSFITDRTGHYSFKRLEGDLDYTVWATWNGRRSSIKHLSLFDTSTDKVIDLEISPSAKLIGY